MQGPNYKLKGLLIAADGTLTVAARKVEIREDRLSRIIHNRVKPSREECQRIAWRLQRSVKEIFGGSGDAD